jgi:hypothetical protein
MFPLEVIGELPIVIPEVEDVNPTLVTVPTLQLLFDDKSKVVPLIVNVLEVGTYPLKSGAY